jgi:RNA polymerase sigma-70 factor (ECF subfamily)
MPHAPIRRHVAETSLTPREDDYARLLQTHWGALVRYARATLGHDDGAEDVVQEAFVALWQQREPLAPERIPPFLYRAVRNRALNERRWGRVRDLWRATQSSDAQTPAPDDEEETERRVREAVAGLPRRRREVFELARYHDLTHQQIALTLSMAPQTVANHMSAALRDLRIALADLLGEASRSFPEPD